MSPLPVRQAVAAPNTGEHVSLGIALMIAASIVVPIADGLVKLVATRYPASELVLLRYGLQTVLMLPVMLYWYGARSFMTRRPVSQALRSVFILSGAFCFFSAVRTIPLADAVAVFFIQPFIVTALAPLALGERVGVWRWSAVAAGFIGALIIIRPGFQELNVGTLYALGSGLSFACFILITRRMAGGDPPLVTNFLTGLGVTVLLVPVMPFVWVTPAASDLPVIAGFAVLGATFSLLIVLAYEYAPASLLAPFNYIELLAAVAVGYILFADLPDAMTWLGMAVIAASGLVIVWRENIRGRRQPAPSQLGN